MLSSWGCVPHEVYIFHIKSTQRKIVCRIQIIGYLHLKKYRYSYESQNIYKLIKKHRKKKDKSWFKFDSKCNIDTKCIRAKIYIW